MTPRSLEGVGVNDAMTTVLNLDSVLKSVTMGDRGYSKINKNNLTSFIDDPIKVKNYPAYQNNPQFISLKTESRFRDLSDGRLWLGSKHATGDRKEIRIGSN
jgi:hypothetical protein